MRTLSKMVLACGVVALLAAPAMAQRPGGGRGFRGGGFGANPAMLLGNKSVQQELKVESTQADKLNTLAQGIAEKQRAALEKLADASQEERREKMAQLRQEANADVQKNLTEILKPEQVKRFRQLEIQQAGILAAPAMPRVSEALDLTDDQKSKFRTIQEEQGEAMRGLFGGGGGGGDREAARQKMLDLRKKGQDKAMAVLTDSQKASWKELTGEPFEVKFEPGEGFGGPGGGRRRNNNN
jgi:hypothetical protein